MLPVLFSLTLNLYPLRSTVHHSAWHASVKIDQKVEVPTPTKYTKRCAHIELELKWDKHNAKNRHKCWMEHALGRWRQLGPPQRSPSPPSPPLTLLSRSRPTPASALTASQPMEFQAQVFLSKSRLLLLCGVRRVLQGCTAVREPSPSQKKKKQSCPWPRHTRGRAF